MPAACVFCTWIHIVIYIATSGPAFERPHVLDAARNDESKSKWMVAIPLRCFVYMDNDVFDRYEEIVWKEEATILAEMLVIIRKFPRYLGSAFTEYATQLTNSDCLECA
ncbi:hypothetical protein MMC28_000471 [Mycoblastus sanguinarius]|nr:hypothetical protein [Mycoblastus sanguinarius]